MDTTELLKKVRRIEIKTRGLSRNIFAGQYHSAFKGRGMAFSEVREYQFGDDVRDIDWNVTARQQRPYIKVYPSSKREKTCPLHHTRIDRFYTRTYGNRAFSGIALSYQRHKKTVYGIFYLRFHYARRFFQCHDHRQPQARCCGHTGI